MKFFASPVKVIFCLILGCIVYLFLLVMLLIFVQNLIDDSSKRPLMIIMILLYLFPLIGIQNLFLRFIRVFVLLIKGKPILEITDIDLIEHVDFKVRIPIEDIKKIKLVYGTKNVLKISYKGDIKRRKSLLNIFLKKNEIGLMFFFLKGKEEKLMEKVADELQELNPLIKRYSS